jgi:cell division protein FtsQ
MNKILKIAGWAMFLGLVILMMGFVGGKYETTQTSEPTVQIVKKGNHSFVSEDKVKSRLNDLGYSFVGQELREIELDRIESELNEVPGVKSTEAYKYSDGTVHIEIKQRNPIARIVLKGGKMGCYLDDEGEVVPLSKDYIAKVPVFTGYISEPYNAIPNVAEVTVNDSIADLHIIDDIYLVAKALAADEFLTAQVVQVYVNKQGEFELIPRVGNHRILLGGADDVSSKLKRLKTFYTSKDVNVKELNMYDTINLKYKNQLVCSNR